MFQKSMCQSKVEIVVTVVLIFPCIITQAIGNSANTGKGNVTQMSLPYVHFVKYRYNITDSVVVTRNVEAIFGNCSTPAVKLRYIVNPNKDGYKMVTSQLFYPNFTRKTKPIRRRSYLHYGFEMVKFDINLTNFMLSATFEGVSATANGGQFAMLPHCDMSTVDKEIIYEFEFVLENRTIWTTKPYIRENRTIWTTNPYIRGNRPTASSTLSTTGIETKTSNSSLSSRRPSSYLANPDENSADLPVGAIIGIAVLFFFLVLVLVFALVKFDIWKKCCENNKESHVQDEIELNPRPGGENNEEID